MLNFLSRSFLQTILKFGNKKLNLFSLYNQPIGLHNSSISLSNFFRISSLCCCFFTRKKAMVVSNDLPPQICLKDVKIRRKRRRRVVKRKELEELIIAAKTAADVARDKGFHKVSSEARQCVDILRHMRNLHLTPPLITHAFFTLLVLATDGNPKIRSETKSLLDHWRPLLPKQNPMILTSEDDTKSPTSNDQRV